jgi:hypothetical protein
MTLVDLAAYHPVWFLQQNFGSAAAPLNGFSKLLAWAERVAAIGHGRHTGRDPVAGELVTSGVHEIVIRRSDPAIGDVCVHFPRAGFVVTSP